MSISDPASSVLKAYSEEGVRLRRLPYFDPQRPAIACTARAKRGERCDLP